MLKDWQSRRTLTRIGTTGHHLTSFFFSLFSFEHTATKKAGTPNTKTLAKCTTPLRHTSGKKEEPLKAKLPEMLLAGSSPMLVHSFVARPPNSTCSNVLPDVWQSQLLAITTHSLHRYKAALKSKQLHSLYTVWNVQPKLLLPNIYTSEEQNCGALELMWSKGMPVELKKKKENKHLVFYTL